MQKNFTIEFSNERRLNETDLGKRIETYAEGQVDYNIVESYLDNGRLVSCLVSCSLSREQLGRALHEFGVLTITEA